MRAKWRHENAFVEAKLLNLETVTLTIFLYYVWLQCPPVAKNQKSQRKRCSAEPSLYFMFFN